MKKLLSFLKDYKKESILAPLFKMLEALFELFVPLVMKKIIDVGIANGDRSYIVRMCLLMVALGVIGLICSLTAQFFAAKAAVGCSTKLRHALFAHIQGLTYSEIDDLGTSTMITRMTSDINQVQSGVNMVLRLFMRSPFIVFGAMIMAFTIDVKAALIFVVTIPVLSVIVFGIMMITMPLFKKVQKGLDRVLGKTRENLTGVRVIRAFAKEEEEIAEFGEENTALTKLQMRVGRISALTNPLTYIVVNLSIAALIWVGALRVDAGIITQGAVIALVNYMSQILVELVKLANLIVTITKALACAGRIEKVFGIKPGMTYGDVAGYEKKKAALREGGAGIVPKGEQEKTAKEPGRMANGSEGSRGMEDVSPVYAVEFKNVGLTYRGAGAESLSGLNFKVKPGETVGIIGGTGSGKTSLINLIPRYYDATEGEVLVDGINVKDYPMEALRDKVGMVMQKAVLFKGTIRQNLQWGRKDATDEEMFEALEIAQAKEFVDTKDGKLSAPITQGGKNLSGGQKQRLTIARALVRKPEILVLDDSASALDYATDAKLRRALREMREKLTVFIVSQRAASIMHADQIVVLDDGHVAGIGRHEELLANCDVYQEIYYSQFKKEEGKEA
ncbi:MAG: ABC transporter ATP-binding protein/permease [Lachnospiraceae bacterium]|nr:ABC transporter ATP-binding protein/permease [Lachnospiraceae bacterium]